jgi:transposase
VINGILWRLRTGAPWRDVPEKYGPWKALHQRLRVWTKDGIWEQILEHLIVKDDSIGTVEWAFSIDSTNVRAHQHAAGARKRGCATGWVEDLAVVDEAIGRSRGGLTSKIHLAIGGRGLPMSAVLRPGQSRDNPQLLPLLDQVSVRRDGSGRPCKRPDRALADKAYSSPSTRRALRARGIWLVSPEKKDHAANRLRNGSTGGRPPAFDLEVYKGRNVVERCFNRLKQFPALATRLTKRAAYYRAELTLAATVLWLRDSPDTA